MRPNAFGYGVAGLVAAAAVAACLGWTVSATEGAPAPRPGATEAAEIPTNDPAAVEAVADEAIRDAAAEIVRRAGLEAPTGTGGGSPRLCMTSIGGWYAAESARGVDDRRSLTVHVTAWRAGAAAAGFAAAVSAASECGAPRAVEGQHEFVSDATRGPGADHRTSGAVRLGDVLVVVESAAVGAGNRELAERAVKAARVVMRPRLAGRCADPSSDTGDGLVQRDPYGGRYVGLLTPVRMAVAGAPVSREPAERALTRDRGNATWQPPTPREFPELATLDLKAVAALGALGGPSAMPEALLDVLGRPLPRQAAPRLVDPDSILPPTDPRPGADPGSAPDLPQAPADVLETKVTAVDSVGPGCGWAFALTQPAATDPLQLAIAGRQAEIDGVAARARRQADWLVATAAWPQEYMAWLVQRRAENNWIAYEEARDDARETLDRARTRYEESVRRWRDGDLPVLSPPAAEDGSDGSDPGGLPEDAPTPQPSEDAP